jgi:hypothetical protein
MPLVLAAAVTGCTNQLAIRQAQLQRFVGQSESLLVSQMGVPDRTYEVEGTKYLAYVDSEREIVTMPPAYPYGPPFWAWYGSGFPPQVVIYACETTFAVSQGVVRSFVLRGNGCA